MYVEDRLPSSLVYSIPAVRHNTAIPGKTISARVVGHCVAGAVCEVCRGLQNCAQEKQTEERGWHLL